MSAASVAVRRTNEDRAAEIFQASLTWVTGDAGAAAAEARRYVTVERWRKHLSSQISGAALGTSIVPGLHGAGLALELPYLFRLMGRGAVGTGALMGAKIEAEDDLAAIFAQWSGAIDKNALAAAAGGVVLVDSVPYPAFGAKVLALGFKIGAKAAVAEVGGGAGLAVSTAAGPVGHMLQPTFAKILTKVSAKISAKIGAKAFAGLVPLVGAAVSIGISRHVLGDFLASARLYYAHKLKDV